jgi:hypothetical protein
LKATTLGGSVKVILQYMCGVPENLKEPENLEISKKKLERTASYSQSQ